MERYKKLSNENLELLGDPKDVKSAEIIRSSLIDKLEKLLKSPYNNDKEKNNINKNIELLKNEQLATVILNIKNVPIIKFSSDYNYFSRPHKQDEIRRLKNEKI